MARFSQALLQGLLNPTYQQGLFEAARGLGQTPGLMMAEKQRKEREKGILGGNLALQQLASTGQVDEAMLKDYAGSMRNLGVASEDILRSVSEARETSKDAQERNAVNQINAIAATMDPSTMSEAELKIKNDKIIDIASKNNIDITPYVGMHMKLISDKIRYDASVEGAKASEISNKYISMDIPARELYKKSAEGQQFASTIMKIDTVLADAERSQILLDKARDTGDYKTYAPRLFKAVQERLDSLEEGEQKEALKAEFKILKEANPDFSAGGTLTSEISASRIVKSLETFNNHITSTVVESIDDKQRADAVADAERNALIKSTLSVSNAEVERFIEKGAAEDALEKSGAKKEGTNWLGNPIYTKEQIAKKARELAVQDRRDIVEQQRPDLFDVYTIGQTYTDANGNKAVYKGNGQWEEVK